MERNKINYRATILVLSLLTMFGCSNVTSNTYKNDQSNRCDTLSLERIKLFIEHKSLAEIASPWDCIISRDTIIESDDEVSWKGVAFYKKGVLLFTVEANWQDSNRIRLINIYNNEVVYNNIRVGDKFSDLVSHINNSDIPTLPDGYLALRDKSNENVLYFLDIEKYPKLQQGISSINQIPNNIRILYISVKVN